MTGADRRVHPSGTRLDERKLLAGRLRAVQAHPYLAGALYAMTIVPSDQVLTMAVDRYWRCYVAPGFVAACDVGQLAGAWLHEVAHLLRDHHARADRLWENLDGDVRLDPERVERERFRMNVAMDLEINDAPPEGEGVRFPDDVLLPEQFDLPAGRLFEEYLRSIPVPHGRFSWRDCGSGARGGDAPWDLGPDGAWPLVGAAAEVIRIRVAEQIRGHPGRTPGSWNRWAQDVGRPTQDWRRLLSAAVRGSLGVSGGIGDHTFRRPGRRSAALGGKVVMPAFTRRSPEVAVVIDTSGSVADRELGVALAETAGVIEAVGGAPVTVYSCDAAVRTAERVSSVHRIRLAGGGGTDLRRGVQRALTGRPRPDVLVLLTDGGTGWPASSPGIPVVVGLFGPEPEPEIDEEREWYPSRRPPAWARTVRIG
ncbi:vWA domain-containing protein [Kineosporia succinea]|uniref:Metal-dependent peptidase n=1 Tax=Kineosporia succinea TaxID=84632 RepID=A0ABT9NZ17_9ACTN|nr:VWA-like domain-containing protein [Kineosporia succinea]MDP9825080.1 putative metal-dependent peptidase [Kineosporia succinea]